LFSIFLFYCSFKDISISLICKLFFLALNVLNQAFKSFLYLRNMIMLPYLLIVSSIGAAMSHCWLPKEVAQWAIDEFVRHEANRSQIHYRGHDRRSSAPFITGDGFRSRCQHVCDESNFCRMTPEQVKDGEFIFVKSDFYEFFATEVVGRIPASVRYGVISHNGDLSTPDGQTDAAVGMKRYVTSDIMKREYDSGRLIAHHGQNLWWKNVTAGQPRPDFLHCIPIGFENRQYPVGKRVHKYLDALRRNVLERPDYSLDEEKRKPLLLVAFYPKRQTPDRLKVLQYLGAKVLGNNLPAGITRPEHPFYNETDLNHDEWLDSVNQHRFVLAPFGHGLDTHRISEILLLGAIPVMRRSTISSCFDDSDNLLRNTNRGSLPVVILDSWNDLTVERLEREWERITKHPKTYWDWKRVFIYHWLERIGLSSD
jgi:hypothetical protein